MSTNSYHSARLHISEDMNLHEYRWRTSNVPSKQRCQLLPLSYPVHKDYGTRNITKNNGKKRCRGGDNEYMTRIINTTERGTINV
jgi:hypothetical protein